MVSECMLCLNEIKTKHTTPTYVYHGDARPFLERKLIAFLYHALAMNRLFPRYIVHLDQSGVFHRRLTSWSCSRIY